MKRKYKGCELDSPIYRQVAKEMAMGKYKGGEDMFYNPQLTIKTPNKLKK